MIFSKFFATAALFAGSVLADKHAECACNNVGTYNWRMTSKACDRYNEKGYQSGNVTYDAASGHCWRSNDQQYLMGNEWEAACREVGQTGFQCGDGQGTCYQQNTDSIRGACFGDSWD